MTALVPDLDGYEPWERPAAQSDPADECARWMAGGVVDNDREERRSSRSSDERDPLTGMYDDYEPDRGVW